MGCCHRFSKTEETIINFLSSSNIKEFNLSEFLKLLNSSENLNETKYNTKHKSKYGLLFGSQEYISMEIFMQMVRKNLINTNYGSEKYKEIQENYLSRISSYAQAKRFLIILFLYPLLKHDSNTILEEFYNILHKCNDNSLNYSNLKQILRQFYTSHIRIPYESIGFIEKDLIIQEDIKFYLENYATDTNINKFVDSILQEFEINTFLNENDISKRNCMVIDETHIGEIFGKNLNFICDSGFIRWSFIRDL